MLIWLMVPVGRCSLAVFRDTPLSTVDGAVPADADKDRVDTGKGFFHTFTHGVYTCYEATPLLDQEQWKSALLLGFAAITVLGWLVDRIERRFERR
jgi:hypothetical protein